MNTNQLIEAMDRKIDSLESQLDDVTKELAGKKRAGIESGATEAPTKKTEAEEILLSFYKQKSFTNLADFVEHNKATSTNPATAGETIEEILSSDVVQFAIDNQTLLTQLTRRGVPQGEQWFKPVLLTRPVVIASQENEAGTVFTETTGATWGRLEADFFKAASMPAFTNEIVNDSTIDVVGMTNAMIGEEYSYYFIDQVLRGRKDQNPETEIRGLLTNRVDIEGGFAEALKPDADRNKEYFQVINTGVADNLPSDPVDLVDFLIDVQTSLNHQYQDSAAWYMTKETFGILRKIKVGATDMRPVLSDGFGTLNQTFMLLGKPVFIIDQLDQVGTADALPIIYGDLGQAVDFLNVEGSSQYVLDPYTIKGQQLHYSEVRMGMCMNNYDSIRVVRCAA